MKDFMVRMNTKCKNLLNQEITLKTGEYISELDGYLYKDGIPFCTPTSQLARNYLIWAGDGHEMSRMDYENTILFNPRVKVWDIEIPVYDGEGNIIRYDKVKREGRFSPEEMDYMREHFSNLLEKDCFLFNNFFYKGSDIQEIRDLACYLLR